MRIVNYSYLREAYKLLEGKSTRLSNKRLRRMAYLDVYNNNYTYFQLYNDYKKVVNSEAANNQLMVLIIVISLITATMIFLFA